MLDFLDDNGKSPEEFLSIKVAQDTCDRNAPETHFAWPEMKKYAMATPRDTLTSAIYFGLFGGQLDDDVAEKVATRLNRSIDAFGIRAAVEKLARLPDYEELSKNDLAYLSQEDTPTARIKRRLKRGAIFGGGGAIGGAALSRLITGRALNPLWVAIPAALAAGVGMAKGAADFDDFLYREERAEVSDALKTASYDLSSRPPNERRGYAMFLKKAAEEEGLSVPPVVMEYAATTYGPRLGAALAIREESFPGMYDHMPKRSAELKPNAFAKELYELDISTGAVANTNIPDAFYSTFGTPDILDKYAADDTLLVVDDEPVKSDFLDSIPKHKKELSRIFSASMVRDLCEHPHRFTLMSDVKQRLIVREIRKASKDEKKDEKKAEKKDEKKDEKK